MDKITMAGDVGGDVGKFIATQEDTNPAAASTKAHVAIDAIAEKARPAVDRLSESAHKATDGLAQAASAALERSNSYVVENPLKAMAVGVAAGLLLGRLFAGAEEE